MWSQLHYIFPTNNCSTEHKAFYLHAAESSQCLQASRSFRKAWIFTAVFDGLIYPKCTFGRLSGYKQLQFAAIQEEEILHAAVPRIYYSSSRLQYTVHIICSSHGPLSPNTNENICRLFQLNSPHKVREKLGFLYSNQKKQITFTWLSKNLCLQQGFSSSSKQVFPTHLIKGVNLHQDGRVGLRRQF